jgi:menaquinone-dependent protoporphyrinogen oxidase
VLRVEQAPTSLTGFDAVIVGSSIHVGKHNKHVLRWVKDHGAALRAVPSAFFQVSLASVSPDDGADEARSYVDHLIEETGWHPDFVGMFGGALLYTQYGFVKRAMMKKIAGDHGLETDTHRDVDYTDYEAVAELGRHVSASLV